MFWKYERYDAPLLSDDQVLPVVGTLVALFLIPIALLIWFSFDFSPPPSFEVPIPEQCAQGWLSNAEVLDPPSIQVSHMVVVYVKA